MVGIFELLVSSLTPQLQFRAHWLKLRKKGKNTKKEEEDHFLCYLFKHLNRNVSSCRKTVFLISLWCPPGFNSNRKMGTKKERRRISGMNHLGESYQRQTASCICIFLWSSQVISSTNCQLSRSEKRAMVDNLFFFFSFF